MRLERTRRPPHSAPSDGRGFWRQRRRLYGTKVPASLHDMGVDLGFAFDRDFGDFSLDLCSREPNRQDSCSSLNQHDDIAVTTEEERGGGRLRALRRPRIRRFDALFPVREIPDYVEVVPEVQNDLRQRREPVLEVPPKVRAGGRLSVAD